MRVFEMKATFPAEPRQEPAALDVYVIAELPEQAIADLTLKGGYDIQIIRIIARGRGLARSRILEVGEVTDFGR